MTDKTTVELIRELGSTFNDYKKANDDRLKALEKNKGVAEAEEKLAKMSESMSDLQQRIEKQENKRNRQGKGGGTKAVAEKAYEKSFENFIRKGTEDEILLEKAASVGDDESGGHAVPETLDMNIISVLRDSVAMRSLASHMSVSNENYKRLVNKGGATSGWVGEEDKRPETTTPKLSLISPFFGELYANPATTQKALDDLAINVKKWIKDEVAVEFAEKEDEAFMTGDGQGKPKGILSYDILGTKDETRAFGKMQFVKSGAAGKITGDGLINLIHTLKKGYRSKAKFTMSNLTLAEVRKLKDADGNYLWRPGLQAGVPSSLLGYSIVENEGMPEMENTNHPYPIGFGDFKRAYQVIDVRGTRVLRDPYTNKPYVHFYTTKRVGNILLDSNAIKWQKLVA